MSTLPSMFERMDEDAILGNFLGLPENENKPDIIIASIPYELTTSYGQGTENGPAACIEASTQVELYDDLLNDNLPAGANLRTVEPWDGVGNSLSEQLEGIKKYAKVQYSTNAFPIFLGGEHGILPPIIEAIESPVTIVQIDAHADLRDELDGEPFSHACAAARALDAGAIQLYQIGIRAYSKEELEKINSDSRINTWFSRDIMSPCTGEKYWNEWISEISKIKGPIHLTIDIDGLDGLLVPSTGTPVPGGLSYWHAIHTIETLIMNCNVISADVNEIVPQKETKLTEFTAAMLVTKIIATKINRMTQG